MANESKSTKVRKKMWLALAAPKIFNNLPIGETNVWTIDSAVGKNVSVNLMELTGDIKSQSYTLHLKVTRIAEGKGQTEIIGYDMNPASVRRLVRRNKDKIDLSFVVETADNQRLRIKPFAITKNSANLSVLHKLRTSIIAAVSRAAKKLLFEQIVQELCNHKFQSSLKKELNKIYPLKIFEIRSMGITAEKPTKVGELKLQPVESEEDIQKTADAKKLEEDFDGE